MQNIDNNNPYQSIQPILPGQQPYPVQFEPLAHIRLSRSTYKVTTFIEFKPYIDNFRNFQIYLEAFLEDLADSSKTTGFSKILSRHLGPVRDEGMITTAITTNNCYQTPSEICAEDENRKAGDSVVSEEECLSQVQLICRAKLQFYAIANATEYIRSAYEQVKEEFLSVIDHLETEDEEEDTQKREQHNEGVQEKLKMSYTKVSREELEVLDDIIKQVGDKYPDLKKKVLDRTKRFGIMSWIMGWGVYANWRQIRAIKKKLSEGFTCKMCYKKNKFRIWPIT